MVGVASFLHSDPWPCSGQRSFSTKKIDSIPISYNSKFPFEFEEFLSWFGILKSGSSPNHVESVVIVGALPRLDVCHFRWGEV